MGSTPKSRRVSPFLPHYPETRSNPTRNLEKTVEVAGWAMVRVAFSAASRSWPFKAGPRWLGTKTRECGLGWLVEPPSVTH